MQRPLARIALSTASSPATSQVSPALLFDSADDRADAGAFLTRVVRLDASALVRLRRAGPSVELWSWLPLDVLVTRRVAAGLDVADQSVAAVDLLASLDGEPAVATLPESRDAQWKGALPGTHGWQRVEAVPSADLQALVRAGADAFRAAALSADPGRVGEALLDHESLTVSNDDTTVAVPLRVLQALARMGFLRADGQVVVAASRAWLRCDAAYGSAYRRRAGGLSLSPA